MHFCETNFHQDKDGKWWVESEYREVIILGPYDTIKEAKEKDIEYWDWQSSVDSN